MRVKYRIPVEHPGHAPAGLHFELDGMRYTFKVEAGKVVELEVNVPNFPIEALPRMTPSSVGNPMQTLSIPIDPVWPVIERRLMFVEGAVAMFGLKKFDFEHRTTEWIPETDEERDPAGILSFAKRKSSSREPLPVAFDMYARALIVADDLAFLEVALNFNRRGRDDISAQRYVEAIYNFYFVLETMFGGGLFKKNQILDKFLNNDQVTGAALSARDSLVSDNGFWRQHPAGRKEFYRQASAKQLIGRVVQIRGVLHHHSGKGSKSWHPSRQSDYAIDAHFLASMSFEIISARLFKEIYSADRLVAWGRIDFRDELGRAVNFIDMDVPPV